MRATFNYQGKKGQPRPAATYRGARRNAARGSVWRGIAPDSRFEHAPLRRNRTRRLEPFFRRARIQDAVTKLFAWTWRQIVPAAA